MVKRNPIADFCDFIATAAWILAGLAILAVGCWLQTRGGVLFPEDIDDGF